MTTVVPSTVSTGSSDTAVGDTIGGRAAVGDTSLYDPTPALGVVASDAMPTAVGDSTAAR
jgi:hypothetical protein